jgi:hypothetical protein
MVTSDPIKVIMDDPGLRVLPRRENVPQAAWDRIKVGSEPLRNLNPILLHLPLKFYKGEWSRQPSQTPLIGDF